MPHGPSYCNEGVQFCTALRQSMRSHQTIVDAYITLDELRLEGIILEELVHEEVVNTILKKQLNVGIAKRGSRLCT